MGGWEGAYTSPGGGREGALLPISTMTLLCDYYDITMSFKALHYTLPKPEKGQAVLVLFILLVVIVDIVVNLSVYSLDSLDSLDFLSPFGRTIFPAHSARRLLWNIIVFNCLLSCRYCLQQIPCRWGMLFPSGRVVNVVFI